MNEANGNLDTLVDAGLTQYEARAYLVLRDLGAAKVTELARASGVPRNKLYGALAGLERRGLAEARTQGPLTYTTRPLSPFIQERIMRLEGLLKQLQEAPQNAPAGPAAAPQPLYPPQ